MYIYIVIYVHILYILYTYRSRVYVECKLVFYQRNKSAKVPMFKRGSPDLYVQYM